MLKFFQEKIQKPADELVKLAEENKKQALYQMHQNFGDCHLSSEDGCEICAEILEDRGDDKFEDKKIVCSQ